MGIIYVTEDLPVSDGKGGIKMKSVERKIMEVPTAQEAAALQRLALIYKNPHVKA